MRFNCLELSRTKFHQQVCVQPPSSALNTTLPALAAERRLQQHGDHSYQSISAARRPRVCCCCCCSRDRQMDGQTPGRHVDPAPVITRAASIINLHLQNYNNDALCSDSLEGHEMPQCCRSQYTVFSIWNGTITNSKHNICKTTHSCNSKNNHGTRCHNSLLCFFVE